MHMDRRASLFRGHEAEQHSAARVQTKLGMEGMSHEQNGYWPYEIAVANP